MTNPLAQAISNAAAQIPKEHLIAAAAAVEDLPGHSKTSRSALIDASPAAHYRSHARTIAQAWAQTPKLPGTAVAAAIHAAAATAETVKSDHDIHLVWTGPTTKVEGLRSTLAVLDALIEHAARSLVLVSFATYDIPGLTASLIDATKRGVEVTLILETPDNPGGPLDFDAKHPFEPLKTTARLYRWPKEARKAYVAAKARLHAKCVIADRSTALITSANLTSAGINDNIELGVLIQAGPLPARLSDHIESLIERGTLESA